MSAKNPIREYRLAWRIRDTNGRWKDIPAEDIYKYKFLGFIWRICIAEADGFRILNFNLN